MRLPHADRGQRASTLERQPLPPPRNQSRVSANVAGTSNATRSHASEIAQNLLSLQHDDQVHRGASGSREHSGKPKRPRSSPKGGHGSNLERPKAIKTSKPSTTRWSCSALAVASASKLVDSSTTRMKPKLRRVTVPPATAIRRCRQGGHTRESRAQPPEHPEGPSRGLAIRVVEAKGGFEEPPAAPKRRSWSTIGDSRS